MGAIRIPQAEANRALLPQLSQAEAIEAGSGFVTFAGRGVMLVSCRPPQDPDSNRLARLDGEQFELFNQMVLGKDDAAIGRAVGLSALEAREETRGVRMKLGVFDNERAARFMPMKLADLLSLTWQNLRSPRAEALVGNGARTYRTAGDSERAASRVSTFVHIPTALGSLGVDASMQTSGEIFNRIYGGKISHEAYAQRRR